jgi:hypothetical protein
MYFLVLCLMIFFITLYIVVYLFFNLIKLFKKHVEYENGKKDFNGKQEWSSEVDDFEKKMNKKLEKMKSNFILIKLNEKKFVRMIR